MKRPLRFTLILASFAATFAVFASSAFAGATTLYASPTGIGNCEAATPCKLEKAVEVVALNEDTVVVEPGTYTLQASGLGIGKEIDIGGQPGAPPPVLVTTSTGNVHIGVAANPHIHDLRIEGNGLILSSGSAERIFVSDTGTSSGCSLSPGTTLIDSVCWAHKGSSGSSPISTGGSTTGTITLRNVTAVSANSSATAIYGAASSGGHLTVNATNLIAIGNNHPDIEAIPTVGGSIAINLSHSDYRTVENSKTQPGTVTAPGTNGNITTLPSFTNAAAGDFTQLAGSPTIDTGLNDPLNGATDLAGNPRSLAACIGGAPITDIGAYEFVPTAACPAPPPPPISNKIRLGKLKLNKKTGTATLSVTVPDAGTLTLSGKGAKKVTRAAKGATTLKLPIKAVGKQKKTLDEAGGLKLSLKLKFTPEGGTAASLTKKLTLRKNVR